MVTGVGDLVLGKEDYPTLTRLSYSLEKQSGNILMFNGSFFGSLLAFVGICPVIISEWHPLSHRLLLF